MYGGKRRYGRNIKPVEQLAVDPSSVPNFTCPHCGLIKTINDPHIEITALEKGQLFMYTKMCAACAILLRTWIDN